MSAVDKLRINYEPPGPISEAFLRSQAFVRGIMGPFGSGKSTLCCVDILTRALAQAPGPDGVRRTRWAIVRQTYPELKTTTIKTWHALIPPNIGQWQSEGPPTHFLRSNTLDAEIMFIALDSVADVKKLLSMDLTGAWVNEAREIPKEVIDGLTARVGRYPSQAQGGASWFGVLMDTNPPDTDHWWYVLAERDNSTEAGRQLLESTAAAEAALRAEGLLREGQHLYEFFRQPSGLSDEAENRVNLAPGYYPRLMAGKSEDWIRVYVRGEYGFLRAGKPVHPQYVDSAHCAGVDIDPAPGIDAVVGLDFGLTPAAALAQRQPNGRWLVFDELVTQDTSIEEFVPLLQSVVARYPGVRFKYVGDPSGDRRADTDKRTVFKVMQAMGINVYAARSNDPVLRRAAVDRPLTRMIGGKPGLIISPRCKWLRKGLAGAFCYRRINTSGERYQLEPDKNGFSHVCEALEYALLDSGEDASIGQMPTPPQRMPSASAWSPHGVYR